MGVPVGQRAGGPARRRVVFAAMYWPLIGGFVALVLVTILIGWIMDAPRRRGADRH
jgi:hypothetical protein